MPCRRRYGPSVTERPETAILKAFGVVAPAFVARTVRATVWKVRDEAGRPAALKVYHDGDTVDEAHGLDLMQAWDGAGAVRLLRRAGSAVLMEWLDGPSLGDLTRRGEDRRAAAELVAVANRLHAVDTGPFAGFPTLSDRFRDLFDLTIAPDCPEAARRALERCRSVARRLLATEHAIRPLHGDLHHDNIRLGARGYCAFDAKGVIGERAYDLANAFRNPEGADAVVRDPARVRFLADCWSAAFDVDRQRLLEWAAAHSALSLAWRSGAAFWRDPDTAIMMLLVRLAEESR